jgi:GNAT superfamily N-acetyltransferase
VGRADLERDAWLIELDGRLAGVAHLLERRGGRFVGDGYVHPELRGRGVGDRF